MRRTPDPITAHGSVLYFISVSVEHDAHYDEDIEILDAVLIRPDGGRREQSIAWPPNGFSSRWIEVAERRMESEDATPQGCIPSSKDAKRWPYTAVLAKELA